MTKVSKLRDRLYDELESTGVITSWRAEAIVKLIDKLIDAKLRQLRQVARQDVELPSLEAIRAERKRRGKL